MRLTYQHLSRIPEEQLLKLRLCDLPLSLQVPWFLQAEKTVLQELRRRHLTMRPHFWISDEWFCPDGVPGVAVPFFLLHPRLERLEKLMMGKVDGSSYLQRLRILRHEVGHAVDNAYCLRRRSGQKRIQIFGDWKNPYPKSYEPQLYSRSYVQHLGDGYAQSHPDEDFAETFAVWLSARNQWRSKYRRTRALEKLNYMDEIMTWLKGQQPVLRNQHNIDPLRKNPLTLKEYYRRKRLQYGVDKAVMKKGQFLMQVRRSVENQSHVSEAQVLMLEMFLRKNSGKILRQSCERLRTPQYKIEPLFRQIVREAQKKQFAVMVNDRQNLEIQFQKMFVNEARKYLHSGGSKILL